MKRLQVIATITCLSMLMISQPAQADSAFSITASQTAMVTGGQVVSIKANNLPADKGIYVQQCVLSGGAPNLAQCTTMQANPLSVLWITNSAASLGQGGANAANAQAFTLVAQIGETSCITSTCGLVTARDHLDRTDRSLDTVTPLTFSALAPALDKSTALTDASDSIAVSLNGLGDGQGVYVRLCAAGDLAQRPTDCDGQGVWASKNAAMLSVGAVDAANPISLPVRGSFLNGATRIDCQLVACGVFIRLDHLASSDHSLDTFIPVTFAKPIAVKQGAGKWLKATGSHRAKLGQALYLANVATKTAQGSTLAWKSQTPSVCVVRTVGTKISVKTSKVGRCTVTAVAKSSSRLQAATFSWGFTVTR